MNVLMQDYVASAEGAAETVRKILDHMVPVRWGWGLGLRLSLPLLEGGCSLVFMPWRPLRGLMSIKTHVLE